MFERLKQRKFERGLFKIIDDYLRSIGQEPEEMTETERNRAYMYYVKTAIDAESVNPRDR